jgi:hypothetical protein
MRKTILAVAFVALFSASGRAQIAVYDPANYAQALARYAVLLRELTEARSAFALQLLMSQTLTGMAQRYAIKSSQAKQLQPQDIYGNATPWATSDNTGAAPAPAYQAATVPLTAYAGYWSLPPDEQARLRAVYAGIELRDASSEAAMSVIGQQRASQFVEQQQVSNLENDSLSDSYGVTQSELLQKQNAAAVLQLRLLEDRNNLALEQLETSVLAQKEQRDAMTNAVETDWNFQTYEPIETTEGTAGLAGPLEAFHLP